MGNAVSSSSPEKLTTVASTVRAALDRHFGNRRDRIKSVCRITGCSGTAVERWVYGEGGINADNLIALMREIDEVWFAVARLAGRIPVEAADTGAAINVSHLSEAQRAAMAQFVAAFAAERTLQAGRFNLLTRPATAAPGQGSANDLQGSDERPQWELFA